MLRKNLFLYYSVNVEIHTKLHATDIEGFSWNPASRTNNVPYFHQRFYQPGKLLKALLTVETRLRYFRMNIQGLYKVQTVRHNKSLQIRLIVVRTFERLVTSTLVFG